MVKITLGQKKMRSISAFYGWIVLFLAFSVYSQDVQQPDWVDGHPDGCTTITVGKKASSDGSVITSHTCDSHRNRGWLDISTARDYPEGSNLIMLKRTPIDSLAMPAYRGVPV